MVELQRRMSIRLHGGTTSRRIQGRNDVGSHSLQWYRHAVPLLPKRTARVAHLFLVVEVWRNSVGCKSGHQWACCTTNTLASRPMTIVGGRADQHAAGVTLRVIHMRSVAPTGRILQSRRSLASVVRKIVTPVCCKHRRHGQHVRKT
jgi:hypothetical protein